MGQVVVVTSGKGGTGKTTICSGVAACLSKLSQNVLCIDADVGLRNLDLALGMADVATVPFTEIATGRMALSDAPRHPQLPQLALLTAPVSDAAVDEAQFADLLEQARAVYDWVLIDAPAGIGSGFRMAAAWADRAIVVAMADPGSLRDADRVSQLLRELGLQQVQLVVNRVVRRVYRRIGATIDDVMDQVGLPLLGMVPEDSNVLLAAMSGQQLICYTDRGAAIAFEHIAKRLMDVRVPLMRIR